MRALICGSVAFDTIMVFNGHFRSHILPDQLHMLNVSFLVPELRREYGGCAGNIAYNMRLLGDEGVPMATVGADAERYVGRLRELGISTDLIRTVEGEYTAQAFITTDLDDNQITAFHPGAMNSAHLNAVSPAQNMSLGIIAPDGREGMLQHAQQFADAGIPFLFDPGQGLPMFDGDELRRFIEQASWVAVNEYEWHLLQSRTGLSIADVTARVKALIITRGAEGSSIHLRNQREIIPPAKPLALVDPTGCGDAYRAGIIHGLLHGLSWPVTGRMASLMGALKIEVRGTQNHRFTLQEFAARYEESFGQPLELRAPG
jgi:adenosine kinase